MGKKRIKHGPAIAKRQSAEAKVGKVQNHKPASTANAKMIRDLLTATKTKGDYKNYVIIAGARLIDWLGSYDIRDGEHLGSVGIKGMALVHKSRLWKTVGEELASNFWDSKLRMRKQFGNIPNRTVKNKT